MGIKILSSKNQISLPEQQRAARHRSQKMAAAPPFLLQTTE